MRVRAVVWYQGEYEGEDHLAAQYSCQFPQMIIDWRQSFNYTSHALPFFFVQLAPQSPDRDKLNRNNGYPELRMAQATALEVPNTGMVTGFDLGDPDTPWPNHSREKFPIGQRLALVMRRVVYGDTTVVSSGAQVTHFRLDSTTLGIYFNQKVQISPTITFSDHNCSEPDGLFEVFNGSSWLEASAKIDPLNQTKVTIANTLGDVYKVRYAWSDAPFCAVYNLNGLPTPPWVMQIEHTATHH